MQRGVTRRRVDVGLVVAAGQSGNDGGVKAHRLRATDDETTGYGRRREEGIGGCAPLMCRQGMGSWCVVSRG